LVALENYKTKKLRNKARCYLLKCSHCSNAMQLKLSLDVPDPSLFTNDGCENPRWTGSVIPQSAIRRECTSSI